MVSMAEIEFISCILCSIALAIITTKVYMVTFS